MDIVIAIIVVCAAGAIGGAANALISDNGFILPKSETSSGSTILRPGALGNIFIGVIAAGVSWGLYGPAADYVVVGKAPPDATPISLSVASMFTAVLIGIGGARWLTNEVDKRLLRAAAAEAAGSTKDDTAAAQIAAASPASALAIAKSMT
jgi:hypothetical protein